MFGNEDKHLNYIIETEFAWIYRIYHHQQHQHQHEHHHQHQQQEKQEHD